MIDTSNVMSAVAARGSMTMPTETTATQMRAQMPPPAAPVNQGGMPPGVQVQISSAAREAAAQDPTMGMQSSTNSQASAALQANAQSASPSNAAPPPPPPSGAQPVENSSSTDNEVREGFDSNEGRESMGSSSSMQSSTMQSQQAMRAFETAAGIGIDNSSSNASALRTMA